MQSYMMGRVKLKIKKLENTNGRQATYAKRKHGIMKKANELSILCDIDIILLMFSPTGKPSLCNGKRSSIEEVIAKFAQLTPQERAKRKLESLEALRKTFKKLDHDVNIQEFLGTGSQTIEDLTNQMRLLQTQISEIHRRLSYWTNPEKINSVEHLGQMENSIRESLNQIRLQKENLGKQQLMSLECTGQFQNGLHIPFRLGSEQQLQPLSWIPNNDNRHMVLPEDPNLLSHRDVECSGSSSFGSYSGYFGTNKSSEISNSGQESSLLSELSGTASLRLQLGGQCSYLPYNVNLLNDKFQPVGEMNIQENPVDYHVSGSLEAPRPGYDTHGSWASTSGPCEVSLFDGRLYSQHLN
ncbi:agamous-like MADS-box protein AGL30 isoform X2 [Pistacia vera]|uniref:agamous-like MADS-box protein AGL30 isoform X2 n=1 Tax=Pistacia vera TaxID=55513 RepID=UPI00126326A1|nr:agamous-like MADS-box protein AGL30 isoform X2 [Pistacia vera]XP_031281768.1 agamous-like MADS-box protein AGL30 isoform X2 [Pistacia vera]